MNGRFQIFLRRRQNQAQVPPVDGPVVNVVVQCNPLTGFAEYVPGNVDNAWYDFTNYIEDVEKTSLTWDKSNSGDSSNTSTSQDGSNYDKGISSELIFFDRAFDFIYNWLLLYECQILNSVEVKIVDLIAENRYRIFEIKNDNLEYAPIDEPCQFRVRLREQDNIWHCIHKTFIWDNWQHWFENSGVKQHPCFLTCIEPRPRLVQSARMALLLFFHGNPVVNLVDWITGAEIEDDARRILNANRFVDAPLVRTYIENVAGKCGLTMDTIFDKNQPFERVCLFFPQNGFMHESDGDQVQSPSLSYHFENRWMITIADLFDKLKILFAAEWYVTPNNQIVFKHTKDLIKLDPIYDFTAPGAEPIYDLVYTFNGNKKPAYGNYEYINDGSDLASQEISNLYNDIIDYDGPAFNPMLEGERVKNFEFASTGFVRDGRAKDYMKLLIHDGKLGAKILLITLILISVVMTETAIAYFPSSAGALATAAAILIYIAIWVAGINGKANNFNDDFVDGPTYNGAVRLTAEQALQPRLLMWDGVSLSRAKTKREAALPLPNEFFNPTDIAYDVKNKIDIDNPTKNLFNYPLYFDGDFLGNLYDKYHDPIDNPLHSLETHQDAKWNVDLCVDMLNLFGVFENQYAAIGRIVKLEHRDNYDVFVRIGNINVDYDNNKINLKGVVIRRAVVAEEGGGGVGKKCDTFEINTGCLVINGSHIKINAA